ncbi:MAG: type IV secretory system conjugative DNA transfer family protein, partial [Intestinibacter sp.]
MNLLKKQIYDNFNFQTTRYAEKEEIKSQCVECTLNNRNRKFSGPIILNEGDKFYIDGSESHTTIFGASGSKKTRLEAFEIVYSTIDAGHSAVISDVKEEIYQRTSGYAKSKGYNVFTLNLRNPKKSNGWNLFSEIIYLFENGYKDEAFEMLSDLMYILFKSERTPDPYWEDTCILLATGIMKILLLGEDDKENINLKNFLCIRSQGLITSEAGPLFDFYRQLPIKSDVYSNLNSVLSLPEKTYGCVMSTFDSKLKLLSMRPDMVEIPDIQIIAPWRDDKWQMDSRQAEIDYCQAHGIDLPFGTDSSYSRDRNLWHISHEGLELEDPSLEPNYEH